MKSDTTTSQLAAQVAACRAENPDRTIVVLTESADWQQAPAAFVAGASDYRLSEKMQSGKKQICGAT